MGAEFSIVFRTATRRSATDQSPAPSEQYNSEHPGSKRALSEPAPTSTQTELQSSKF
jgi:hypothetical protein